MDVVLDDGVLDRAAGALLGLAVGDALGAPYEFSTPGPDTPIEMRGNRYWDAGEWTDDTCQAIAIAEATALGMLDTDLIAQRFWDWWEQGGAGCGTQTRRVLLAAGGPERLADAAAAYHAENPRRSAGNGTLMRTSPVALACLGDDAAIARHAMRVAAITHGDPLAGEACVLWCVAVDRAVREERLDGVREGLALLPPDRAAWWARKLDEADAGPPSRFRDNNGFVVTALQAAHAAIVHTPIPDDVPSRHLAEVLLAAVRIGHDTDTVAAIAGQLVGARWGASAIPPLWRDAVHGWPGMRAGDLVALAHDTVRAQLG